MVSGRGFCYFGLGKVEINFVYFLVFLGLRGYVGFWVIFLVDRLV